MRASWLLAIVLILALCQGQTRADDFYDFDRSGPTRATEPEPEGEFGPSDGFVDYKLDEEPAKSKEDERIEKIVDARLAARDKKKKEEDEKKKKEEEAKKKAEADLGTEVGSDLSMTAKWNNGIELSTKDKAFKFHAGGRYQMDAGWFSADQSVQQNINRTYQDGVDFRRARFRMDGTLYEVWDYASEYDFVNSDRIRRADGSAGDDAVTGITDLWIANHTPYGLLKIGNQKDAIGFEHLVSSRFLPFMERSFNQDAFYGGGFNGFLPGVSLGNTALENRASWNIGLYKPTNNVFAFNATNGDYNATGRVTYLPIYEDEGKQLVHLGMSVSNRSSVADRIRFRTRDAIRTGISSTWPIPADTGNLAARDLTWLNFELAAVNGPFTLQAEYLASFTNDVQRLNAAGNPIGVPVDSVFYHGGYVQFLWFLTGESDRYSFERATFDRVVPTENQFWVRDGADNNLFGRGAWQIGARYNYLDLNDRGFNGGQLHNFTYGLNWFFNPNMKLQLNYMFTYRDVAATTNFPNGSGWIHGWGMRFAHDF